METASAAGEEEGERAGVVEETAEGEESPSPSPVPVEGAGGEGDNDDDAEGTPSNDLRQAGGFALGTPASVTGRREEPVGLSGLVRDIATLIPGEATEGIGRLQQKILSNLQSTNKTVTDFNIFSEEKYASISPDLGKLAKNLRTIKNDLDYIYKKTSTIKAKLKGKYPEAFAKPSPS